MAVPVPTAALCAAECILEKRCLVASGSHFLLDYLEKA